MLFLRLINLLLGCVALIQAISPARYRSSLNDTAVLVDRDSAADAWGWNLDLMEGSPRLPDLKSGFIDAVTLVKAVMGADGWEGIFSTNGKRMHKKKFRSYFGVASWRDRDGFIAVAKSLYEKIFDPSMHDTNDIYGTLLLKQLKVFPDDWLIPFEGIVDGADGRTTFCSLVSPEGKKAKAYFGVRGENQGPGIHFCEPAFFEGRVTLGEFTGEDDTCSALDDEITNESWSLKLWGPAILHEFTHWSEIGREVVGYTVRDPAYGINNVLALADDKYWKEGGHWFIWDKDAPVKPVFNADTWAWFALHVYMHQRCKREFKLPPPSATLNFRGQDHPVTPPWHRAALSKPLRSDDDVDDPDDH